MLRVRRGSWPCPGEGVWQEGSAGAERPAPLQPCSGKERVLGSGNCSVPSAFRLKMELLVDGSQTVGFWFKAGCVEGEASRAGMPAAMSPCSSRSLALCRDGLPEMFPGHLRMESQAAVLSGEYKRLDVAKG